MRLLTKAQREENRKYQFESLTKNGYLMTEYKNLVIFHHPTELLLKTFWGTAANHTDFYKYRTSEQLTAKIESLKATADSRDKWKAEQKERKSLSGAKITLSTLKKFVRENAGNIYVKVLSSFDGMTDCVERVEDDFKLMAIKEDNGNNLGLSGVHLVGSSRDSFTAYNSTEFEGIEIYNSCGSCIVARKKETTQQAQKPAEVPAGKIRIVDYSEKAFAVIGEFSPLYDSLINLGGNYNSRLKCGKGIIFSKKRLDDVRELLIKIKGNNTTEQQQQSTGQEKKAVILKNTPAVIPAIYGEIPEPQSHKMPLDYFKIIWHEGRQTPDYEGAIFNTWAEVQDAFLKLWEVNEAGQDGGYTKVKVEMKLTNEQDPHIFRVDITNKTKNGDFNPSNEHIIEYLQNENENDEQRTQAAATQRTNLSQPYFLKYNYTSGNIK